MLQITESEILEAYDAFELSESELIELYSEGYISENTMDQLIEMGIFDELIMESSRLKSFGRALASQTAKVGTLAVPGAIGALGGAAIGGAIGGATSGPLGGALGAKFGAKLGGMIGSTSAISGVANSGQFKRFAAKLDNWSHDAHYREHHRDELKKAIKNKDSKKAAYHRTNMLRHQERMQKHLELNRGSKYVMNHYDENGDEVKTLK